MPNVTVLLLKVGISLSFCTPLKCSGFFSDKCLTAGFWQENGGKFTGTEINNVNFDKCILMRKN